MNISCCAYSEISTRSRCLVVIYIETDNMTGKVDRDEVYIHVVSDVV
jgi:hypothetical protein